MTYTQPNLATSALITVDTQNDFTLDGAPAQVPGTIAIIPNMVRLLRCYRELRLPIIHIVRIYLPDGSNADLCRRAVLESGAKLVLPGSIGVDLVADLKPNPTVKLDTDRLLKGHIQQWSDNEVVIYKPRWGAFHGTPLSDHLKILNIDTLLFCGCNFPNCPRTSIYEASARDYKLMLAEDALSGLYEKGRQEMENIGVEVVSTETILAGLS
ncbi:MAG: isochorismatase family cysteine hydrolase [Candidatus Competibacteraceae bacterium]|jgi:nicotinamidase-related amidase|nr:isochorismatase family cysteine hydrolase [Candidatus Competibacteraceae bacterium]